MSQNVCIAGKNTVKHKLQSAQDNIDKLIVHGTYLFPLHLTVLKYVIKFIQTRNKNGK